MPGQFYLAWKVLLVVLAVVAFAVGTWRQRLAPIVLFLTYVAGTVALTKTGLGLAPRYLQPAFIAFPLLWGEVILLNRYRLAEWPRRALVLTSVTFVAVTHGVALLFNGRRFSVGTAGGWSYLFDGGEWAPPGGWLPWTALAAAGAAALVVGFARASFKEVPLRGSDPKRFGLAVRRRHPQYEAATPFP